jgi:hypothetical protein
MADAPLSSSYFARATLTFLAASVAVYKLARIAGQPPLNAGAWGFIAAIVLVAVADTQLRRRPAMAPKDDPRWGPGSGRPQIAGATCLVCAKKITMVGEGTRCASCDVVLHAECEVAHATKEHAPDQGAYR